MPGHKQWQNQSEDPRCGTETPRAALCCYVGWPLGELIFHNLISTNQPAAPGASGSHYCESLRENRHPDIVPTQLLKSEGVLGGSELGLLSGVCLGPALGWGSHMGCRQRQKGRRQDFPWEWKDMKSQQATGPGNKTVKE